MRISSLALLVIASPILLAACGSSPDAGGGSSGAGGATATGGSAGTAGNAGAAGGGAGGSAGNAGAAGSGAAGSAGAAGAAGAGGATGTSKIEHVVVIVQENHTFDAYFGRYCTAPAGALPTCNTGPGCCEEAPTADPSGAGPVTLNDAENSGYDPNHTQSCELAELDNGKMDRFVTGASCSNAKNFAVADANTVGLYRAYASQYAIGDRYFQSIAGSSSSNDMYFAAAHEEFIDNSYKPDTNGAGCIAPTTPRKTYTGQTTIADLLIQGGHTFTDYAMGYAAMKAAKLCPAAPSDCPAHIPTAPCDYDPSDNPFQYYAQFADNATYMKDYDDLAKDITAGNLPEVSFVKAVQYKNEHPGYGTVISTGEKFVQGVVDAIFGSQYAKSTLVLLTWDEGGGFFDHVAPPPTSPVDNQPYGTRVPIIAIGPFAKKNYISHVTIEHSSIVKFIEWNFLEDTGQLGARDAVVNNIGDLLDPGRVGVVVPAD